MTQNSFRGCIEMLADKLGFVNSISAYNIHDVFCTHETDTLSYKKSVNNEVKEEAVLSYAAKILT